MDREKVIKALEHCSTNEPCWEEKYINCPYTPRMCHNDDYNCVRAMAKDALELLKEHKEERKRMLSWLSKFCRHIDNGDKWLTDDENLEFFREKMKQQFGWFSD